jgi:hypothetical protein
MYGVFLLFSLIEAAMGGICQSPSHKEEETRDLYRNDRLPNAASPCGGRSPAIYLGRRLLLFIGFLWSLILLTSDEQETVQNLKINSSSLISCAVNSSSYHYVQTIPSSTLRVDASRHLQTSAMFPVCMCKYDPMRENTTSVRVNSTLGSMPLPIASGLVPNYASQTTTARLLRLLSRE